MQLLWVILVCQFACWVFGSLCLLSLLVLFLLSFVCLAKAFQPSYHESFEILVLSDPDIRQEPYASISVIVGYIDVTKLLMQHSRFVFDNS